MAEVTPCAQRHGGKGEWETVPTIPGHLHAAGRAEAPSKQVLSRGMPSAPARTSGVPRAAFAQKRPGSSFSLAAQTGREFPGSHCDISDCALEAFLEPSPPGGAAAHAYNDSSVAGQVFVVAVTVNKIKSLLVLKATDSSKRVF